MPTPEGNGRHQTAVLWVFNGYDRYGEPKVLPPREITVRWEWTKRNVLDDKGNTIAIDAQVKISENVPVDSRMWLGTLDDISGTGTGTAPDYEWMTVVTSENTPDLKGRVYERWVTLAKYRDS